MRLTRFYIWAICLLTPLGTLLTGCRDSLRHKVHPSDPEIPRQIITASDVESYALSDPACQSNVDAGIPLESATLDLWNDGALAPVMRDLAPLAIHSAPLGGPVATRAMIGSVFSRACDSDAAGPPDCLDKHHQSSGFSLKTEGTPIKICHPSLTPPKNSLEQIALTTIEAVESAALTLRANMPAGTVIEPVTILVMPRFQSLWLPWTHNGANAGYEMLIADNLAYFPATAATPPYIAVFPKQKRNKETISLWNSEFVIAHEFAHHMERALRLDHFDSPRSLTRLAVSEGFADVLAFASHGASNRALKGIPCIEKDRAPDEFEFNAGIPKLIDRALLDRASDREISFSSPSDVAGPCQGILPHSAHGIGAIFAHWVWELSSYMPDYAANPGHVLTTVSIDWLARVETAIHAGTDDPKKDLESVATALRDAVKSQFNNSSIPMTPNIRDLLRQKMSLAFPVLGERDWFPE